MENLSQTIGKNIRKYRSLNGMTREKLAEAVDLDPAYLGQCERGERQLGLSKTVELIKYFGVSANDILDIKSIPSSENKIDFINKINECLNTCSDNQLNVILNVITCLVPFLKD